MATGTNVLSAAERSIRSVFVGNIPYEATEEQLKDIFSEVGPVVSFRLVYDRETGKPKGYGFCEYKDQETALSAMRNLNGYELNGRALRVDNAASEKSKEELKNLQNTLGGPPVESPYGPEIDPKEAPNAIAKVMSTLPPIRMYEIMKEMKLSIQNHPNESRTLLLQNPQLAYALLQALVVMKIVDTTTAASFLHQNTFREGPSVATSQAEQRTAQQLPPPVYNNMPQNVGASMQPMNQNITVDIPPMDSQPLASMPNAFNAQQQVPVSGRGFHGVPSATSQPQSNPPINIARDAPPSVQLPQFSDTSVSGSNDSRLRLQASPLPPGFSKKGPQNFPPYSELPAMGDHDMRQPPMAIRQSVGDRDMREHFGLGDKDMRALTTDQDLRTMSLSQIVVEKLCPESHYPRPSPPVSQFGPQLGHQPTIFDQRRAFAAPPATSAEGATGTPPQQKQVPRAGVPVSGKSASQPQPIPGSMSFLPNAASLAQAASNLVPNDQEKASLILQVLQLSDHQIAVLPPEQRQSIMILKEQFARSAQGT